MSSAVQRAIVFAALLAWCAALILGRMHRETSTSFLALLWNLFLAVIPAVAAAWLVRLNRRGGSAAAQATLAVLWLLFLPNAPYIVTDFVHLVPQPNVPLWYDIALLVSCATTGLLLGYTSVADVQAVVTRRSGRAAGWAVASGALLLSGFGIYLGRFLRLNSWDVVSRPGELARYLAPLAEPLSQTRTLGVTAVYGGGLTLGYVALRVLATSIARRGEPR